MASLKKTISCVIIAFLISFFALLAFQHLSRSYVDIFYLQDQFYSQKLDSEDTIFILGSSESAVLNNTRINEHLRNNGYKYDVYNLVVPSDQPSTRLQTIEKIIKLNPKVVFYGVGFRDFANQFTIIQQKQLASDNPLPDPQKEFNRFIANINSHYDIVRSPKFVTAKMLDVIINTASEKKKDDMVITQPKTPFYRYTEDDMKINQNINTIESIGMIDPPVTNDEAIALNEIINRLKSNNIKVVVFTTPYAKIFFDNLNDYNKSSFEAILNELAEDDVPIYQFHDKYTDLNIWNDYNHIAIAPEAIIFTNDVEKMITTEVD